jgi:hypothetical protein
MENIQDVICPDGSECQDGQTCCEMNNGVKSYGCCPLPNVSVINELCYHFRVLYDYTKQKKKQKSFFIIPIINYIIYIIIIECMYNAI